MQLFSAVAELRARGLQANLAAWYPWIKHLETVPRVDSCAIILIGPCEGIRMTYDCSVWGIEAPERPSRAWHYMELVTTDDRGREIEKGPMRYEPVHEVDGNWDDQTPVGGEDWDVGHCVWQLGWRVA